MSSEGTRSDRLPLDRSPEWAELGKHRAQLGEVHLRELFAADPRRGERYARLKIRGAAFDIPTDDPQMKPGTPQRFAIDMNRLTVWPI